MEENKIYKNNTNQDSEKKIRISMFKIIELEAVRYSLLELIILLVFILLCILIINSGFDLERLKNIFKYINEIPKPD